MQASSDCYMTSLSSQCGNQHNTVLSLIEAQYHMMHCTKIESQRYEIINNDIRILYNNITHGKIMIWATFSQPSSQWFFQISFSIYNHEEASLLLSKPRFTSHTCIYFPYIIALVFNWAVVNYDGHLLASKIIYICLLAFIHLYLYASIHI